MSAAPAACLALAIGIVAAAAAVEPVGERPDWRSHVVVLDNGVVRVGVDALNGGRLVEYSLAGRNALLADATRPDEVFVDGDRYIGPTGGRFDIGPEDTLPAHPDLWQGAWTIEAADRLQVRMTSSVDAAIGVQVTREILLHPGSAHLRCVQTIINRSDRPRPVAHWGRTLVPGGGIFLTALTPGSRFPRGYVALEGYPSYRILTRPEDPAVTIHGDLVMLRGALIHGKLGFDTNSGWLAYLLPGGQLFVKRFPVFPERRYADIAGLTIAVWSLQDRIVELEPLGPEERLDPGGSAAFAEDWWLFDHPFPAPEAAVDPAALRAYVDRHAVVTR